MRRTKHRRRFHTDRVIANRQRRARRILGHGDIRRLEDGRLDNTFAYGGCSRSRCGVCKWSKYYLPNSERIEAARRCRDWWEELQDVG